MLEVLCGVRGVGLLCVSVVCECWFCVCEGVFCACCEDVVGVSWFGCVCFVVFVTVVCAKKCGMCYH